MCVWVVFIDLILSLWRFWFALFQSTLHKLELFSQSMYIQRADNLYTTVALLLFYTHFYAVCAE